MSALASAPIRARGRQALVGALAVVLTIAVAVAIASGSPASSGPRPEPGAAKLLGPTNPNSILRFSLVLRLPGQRRLSHFLAALYDPRSPSYHHFIDAKTFGQRFGARTAQLASVSRRLRDAGIQVTGEYPQRTALDARASTRAIERLFGVRMMDYLAPDGRRFHAPLGTPELPASLRAVLSAVAGLDERNIPAPRDVPRGGLAPADASTVYDLEPLYHQGIDGQGEKVAILSLATFNQSDLDGFAQQFGLPPISVQQISPSQLGPATDTGKEPQGEVELDIEMVHGIAPAAQILDYNAPNTIDAFPDILDKIVADGQANIVSVSWGLCEPGWPTAEVQRMQQAVDAALSRGISIFVAAGDAGAYDCQRAQNSDHHLAVDYPASSPGVVAVGGTSLSVTQTGGYAGEAPWEGALEESGGGGGRSVMFARPSWQQGTGVANRFSNGSRQVPDVAADADPYSGWSVFEQGQVIPVGGTSAAAPFWASSMALIAQYARLNGIGALGFVDPTLYALASSPQPAPPFHDVTFGTNRYYPATAGWDFATGLGSPDVYNLAEDMVRYMKARRR